MKLDGNLWSPLKFSSLKYDMTWFDCFQKFMVSCCRRSARPSRFSLPAPPTLVMVYLVLRVALEEKDIDDWKLVDESVALELLPDTRPDDRHGEGDVVHGLNFGCLRYQLLAQRPLHTSPSHGSLAATRRRHRMNVQLESTAGMSLAPASAHRPS